ncbi:MAG: penicillin-binding protein 2 [Candidatus Kapabacteria bacterium]|nr:penicillin-binding protein 2 [Candidatus Kapabacteria bacterium]MCS7169142.1 penicillin-binding protein 2 [Candidatus Kapabacteria bacterium]MDW7996475.1 penicillin-binding protein 2 [Bacteroidota bacterium]MDW8225906.1 penicillin-binding protein 2 [Bacteroidota bacterium]
MSVPSAEPTRYRSGQRRWIPWVVAVMVSLGFGVVWVRLFHLHVLSSEKLRVTVQQQAYVRLQLFPTRGEITDRHGEVLAASVEAPSYGVDPVAVRCAECLCGQAHRVLGIDSAECLRRISTAQGRFLWLRRGVWGKDTRGLDTLDEPGLVRLRERARVYVYGNLFLPVLGGVGIDQQGLSGLELTYDSLLRTEPVTVLMRRDARGRLFPTIEHVLNPPPPPLALRTTLDANLQRIVAYEVTQGVRQAEAAAGIAVAMESATGAIRACAVVPNPPLGSAHAPLVSDVYEPGSILKPIIAAAALEQGLLRITDTLDGRNGYWDVSGHRITDEYPLGQTTIRRALALSSNIVFAELAQRLPKRVLYRYVRDFGFGVPTGIVLPAEASGIVPKPEQFQSQTPLFWGFGYGLAATPLQLACAYAAIANDGVLMQPRLVEAFWEPAQGDTVILPPRRIRQVITAGTARQLRELLISVVEEGTGQYARIPGLAIAGKTGTAQQLVDGRYSREAHTASFVAIVPAEHPRMVVLVMIVQPRRATSGGQVAAPVVRRILQRMAAHSELSAYVRL